MILKKIRKIIYYACIICIPTDVLFIIYALLQGNTFIAFWLSYFLMLILFNIRDMK